MGSFLAALITAALAQEPPVAEAPVPPAPPVEEVVVWGRLAIDNARDDIVHEFESLGFSVARRDGDEVIFRSGSYLVRKITLGADGTLTFGRPVAGLTEAPPVAADTSPDPRTAPSGQGGASFFLLPSERKMKLAQDKIVEATRDEIAALRAVQRRTELEERLLNLPDQLDRLWADGTPLDPGPRLETPEDRRRAVLTRWATRIDTEEGRRVRETLEAWIGSVVQQSPTPITDAERTEFETKAGRPLP
jgi:hypothetical protein